MTIVTLWGTRGSLASPGPETARYGGNTACVQVQSSSGSALVLDAGTGIRHLGGQLMHVDRVDLLLTHLHMDHVQGLGFFGPLYNPGAEVHIWGPASITMTLRGRLARYLSPPLFPVRLRDLPCRLVLHEVPCGDFTAGDCRVSASHVCHPGPTVGYRIVDSTGFTITYLPDHEPALGLVGSYREKDWTSGYDLAREADLLIHDAQYTASEYREKIGWGHSSVDQALEFAILTDTRHFVPFHHDPSHTDQQIDAIVADAVAAISPPFPVSAGSEGATFRSESA